MSARVDIQNWIDAKPGRPIIAAMITVQTPILVMLLRAYGIDWWWIAGAVLLLPWLVFTTAAFGTRRKPLTPRRRTPPPTRTFDQKREWRAEYVNAWTAAHPGLSTRDRGHWRPGDKTGRDYWITNTPEWDVKWFHAQGWYLPHPWRMLDAIDTARIDCGDGLNQIGVAE